MTIPSSFPDPRNALTEPNGLLCQGGNLNSDTLLDAYTHGIFPWFNEGEPILWWSPDPRFVIDENSFRLSRSLRKTIRRNFEDADDLLSTTNRPTSETLELASLKPPELADKALRITCDSAFNDVIVQCATNRHEGTWISPAMIDAYKRLFREGYAHSVELWREQELIAGFYGIAIGTTFCGESMFTKISDGSKICFAIGASQLFRWGYKLIDCQIKGHFLAQFGGYQQDREEFLSRLVHGIREQAALSNLLTRPKTVPAEAQSPVHCQNWHRNWLSY